MKVQMSPTPAGRQAITAQRRPTSDGGGLRVKPHRPRPRPYAASAATPDSGIASFSGSCRQSPTLTMTTTTRLIAIPSTHRQAKSIPSQHGFKNAMPNSPKAPPRRRSPPSSVWSPRMSRRNGMPAIRFGNRWSPRVTPPLRFGLAESGTAQKHYSTAGMASLQRRSEATRDCQQCRVVGATGTATAYYQAKGVDPTPVIDAVLAREGSRTRRVPTLTCGTPSVGAR